MEAAAVEHIIAVAAFQAIVADTADQAIVSGVTEQAILLLGQNHCSFDLERQCAETFARRADKMGEGKGERGEPASGISRKVRNKFGAMSRKPIAQRLTAERSAKRAGRAPPEAKKDPLHAQAHDISHVQ